MGANQVTVLEHPTIRPIGIPMSSSAFGHAPMDLASSATASGWFAPRSIQVVTSEAPQWLPFVASGLAACSLPHEIGLNQWLPGASFELIAKAVSVLSKIMQASAPTPSVIRTATGSVQYVWHKAGWDVEIEVAEGFVEAWAHERETGREIVGKLEDVQRDVAQLIAQLGRDT
jgi:hypothetical protein